MSQFAIALVGALTGVLFTEWRRNRRDERLAKQRLLAAARMVHAEFGMAALMVDGIEEPESVVRLANLPVTAWTTHGAELAAAMSERDFYVVMDAGAKVSATRAGVAMFPPGGIPDPPPSPEVIATIKTLAAICQRARDMLEGMAYPMMLAAAIAAEESKEEPPTG